MHAVPPKAAAPAWVPTVPSGPAGACSPALPPPLCSSLAPLRQTPALSAPRWTPRCVCWTWSAACWPPRWACTARGCDPLRTRRPSRWWPGGRSGHGGAGDWPETAAFPHALSIPGLPTAGGELRRHHSSQQQSHIVRAGCLGDLVSHASRQGLTGHTSLGLLQRWCGT